MTFRSVGWRILWLWLGALFLAGIAAAAAMNLGPYPANLSDLWSPHSQARDILLRIRLPRILAAELAGGVLAASGVVFQALLRNPLAEPYTLGVASGASLGAAAAIVLGWTAQVAGLGPISLMALVGSLVAMVVVYGAGRLLARRSMADTSFGLVLAGICLALTFQALIFLLHYMADYGSSYRLLHWLMGGLGLVGFDGLFRMVPLALTGLALQFVVSGDLNYLYFGEEIARSRGVAVSSVQKAAYFGASMATAGVVSAVGPIGFVGLVVPHVARGVVGTDVRLLLPSAAGLGAVFLLGCDTAARTLFAPTELPAGVLTALVGGPAAILVLLLRSRAPRV